VAGDFSGDGRTDLAVANQGSNDVSVLLGNGDGIFQHQVRYAAGAEPDALVAGDFSGDGRTDLAVADYASNDVSVLLGNGDGTFQTQTTYPVGTNPFALVTGDFNGDGRPDLAVANYGSNDVSVLLSLNGTFADPGPFAINLHATPLVTDLSGNGANDVMVINGAGDILWRKGRPQEPGTFDPPITINPGHPARDIVAVDTHQGHVLASVDATDNAISLYASRDGNFVRIGSLPTGSLPAQIVTADLTGDGWDDLVVRDVGDGTLTVFFNNGSGSAATGNALFPSSVTLSVGLGVSDVTLADVDRDGATDILVTNKVSGEVGVWRNLGHGAFAPAVLYRAGGGLYGVMNNTDGSASLTTLEATSGVAVGAFTRGGPPDLVVIDPGSNTFSLLKALGAGRFANPVTRPTTSPARAVRVADLDGIGVPDMIVLGTNTVSVYRGNGQGDFLPPLTYPAGPGPTGLTVADVNHDGKPDLLLGNSFGDLLVLLGNGDGTFQLYRKADQNVALAVLPNGSPTPDFIYANQGLDHVVIDYGGGQKAVVGDKSTGLLAPGAVQLADLNGDGIPDLIVANSGSNNVLIYPGLGDGQFGPALNGGHGFFTGTNPVGISVADVNGDGRPDLVVANKGSNDVSILLNQPQGTTFTFTPGPRLRVGSGPVSTVVQDVNGDGIPDILVSDSQSNNVILLPGVGGGFFNDQNPRVFPVGISPGPVFVGNFDGSPGLLTVNSGSNDLTLISDFMGASPVTSTISSGGIDPVAALVFRSSNGFDDVIVADNGDGHLALLEGGAEGLILSPDILESPELPNPTDLAFSSFIGDQVEFYATTEGREAVTLLIFLLGGETGPPDTSPAPGGIAQVAQLLPLSDSSLPLITTMLILTIETSTAGIPQGATDAEAPEAVSFLPVTSVTAGQSLPELAGPAKGESGDEEEPNEPQNPGLPVSQGSSPWQPFLMGLDEALNQLRRDSLDQFLSPDKPATDGASSLHVLEETSDLWQHARTPLESRAPDGSDTDHLPLAHQEQMIDEAIRLLWSDESRPTQTSRTPTSAPLTSDRKILVESGPTVATMSSIEPVNRREWALLSSLERGYKLVTEFAVSLLAAAVAMSKGSDSQTSSSLLAMLQQDPANAPAWDEFVRRYRPKVYGWCRKRGLQEADAEDVTQSVLAKLTEAMRDFRYDRSRSFRAWLKTITQRAWSDLIAHRHRATGSGTSQVLQRLQTLGARADLERQLEEAFDRELLEVATLRVQQRVAPQTWEAFRLMALEGLPGAEASRRLLMPVAHVFVAKHRVQKMLKEELRRLEHPDRA
jgi:RNA polymerase sigma factor (sigma-70 family)